MVSVTLVLIQVDVSPIVTTTLDMCRVSSPKVTTLHRDEDKIKEALQIVISMPTPMSPTKLPAINIIDNTIRAEDTMRTEQPQIILRITDGSVEKRILGKGKEKITDEEKEKEDVAVKTLFTLPSITTLSSSPVKLGPSPLVRPQKLLMSSVSPLKELEEDIDLDEVIELPKFDLVNITLDEMEIP